MESLAPPAVILSIINDWFELYHPVCPVLHRDDLLRRLHDKQSSASASFLCLIASVVATTCMNLRRHGSVKYIEINIDHCFEVAEGLGFFRRSNCIATLERAQVSCIEYQSR